MLNLWDLLNQFNSPSFIVGVRIIGIITLSLAITTGIRPSTPLSCAIEGVKWIIWSDTSCGRVGSLSAFSDNFFFRVELFGFNFEFFYFYFWNLKLLFQLFDLIVVFLYGIFDLGQLFLNLFAFFLCCDFFLSLKQWANFFM